MNKDLISYTTLLKSNWIKDNSPYFYNEITVNNSLWRLELLQQKTGSWDLYICDCIGSGIALLALLKDVKSFDIVDKFVQLVARPTKSNEKPIKKSIIKLLPPHYFLKTLMYRYAYKIKRSKIFRLQFSKSIKGTYPIEIIHKGRLCCSLYVTTFNQINDALNLIIENNYKITKA